jgi:hypothetical protein
MRLLIKRRLFTISLLLIYFLSEVSILLPVNSKAQDSQDLSSTKILPTIATAELYSFNGERLDSTNTYQNFLRFEKSGITWYNTEPEQRIIKVAELKNKDSICYWYRVPLKMSYNAYTVCKRQDVVEQQIGTNFESRIARIYKRPDWSKDYSGPTSYYIKIPYYDISTTGGSPTSEAETQTEISAAKDWFLDKFTYNGQFMIRIKLTPDLGMPTSIEDGKWVANYTAIRLSNAVTVNNGDATNLIYDIIANQGRTYVGYNVPDDQLSGGTSDTPTLSSGSDKMPTKVGDCKTGYSGQGLSDVIINPAVTLGEVIMPTSKGAALDIINKNTNQKLIDLSKETPVENLTDWLIPLQLTMQPKFTLYSTTWKVKEVKSYIDNVDEAGALGDAGVRAEDWNNKNYVTVNGWRVDNIYIHQEIAFYVDVAVKYNLIAEDDDLSATDLSNPEMQIGDDVFDAFVEGTTEYGATYSKADSYWDTFWKIFPIVLIVIVVVGVIIYVRQYLPAAAGGSGGGGGGGSTKINIQQTQQSKDDKGTYKPDMSMYKAQMEESQRMQKNYEEINKRLDKLLDENARLRAEKEDLEKIAKGMG